MPLLLAFLLACGAVEVAPEPTSPAVKPAPAQPVPAAPATPPTPVAGEPGPEVDITEFAARKAAGQVPLLVDVRTDEEWESGHVPGAVHIPMQQIQSRLSELDAHKDDPIFFICASGGRSGRVAEQVRKVGYQAVNVAGGTSAWKAAGHPVE